MVLMTVAVANMANHSRGRDPVEETTVSGRHQASHASRPSACLRTGYNRQVFEKSLKRPKVTIKRSFSTLLNET
jgi:hypothetical protein